MLYTICLETTESSDEEEKIVLKKRNPLEVLPLTREFHYYDKFKIPGTLSHGGYDYTRCNSRVNKKGFFFIYFKCKNSRAKGVKCPATLNMKVQTPADFDCYEGLPTPTIETTDHTCDHNFYMI